MILLDKPYVSDFLKQTILDNKIPVLDSAAARRALGDCECLVSEQQFVDLVRKDGTPRLYSNSENAIGWMAEHLGFTGLPDFIALFKDKVRFRELMRPLYPEYNFQGVAFEDLADIDPARFAKPFIIKPAVGFFSLGVHKVDSDAAWPEVVAAIRREVKHIQEQYPEQVLAVDQFIIEESIPGEEFAVDVYWNDAGEPVILNILHHIFPDEDHVNDRAYVSSADIMRERHDVFAALMRRIGDLAKLKNFPAHVELRVAGDDLGLIEVNPMRFAGWCVADLTWHAWGFNPYLAYLKGDAPNWDALCAEREGTTTSVVIADIDSAVDTARIQEVDYEAFTAAFTKPLELRRIDWTEYPVFAFLFAQHTEATIGELDPVLASDLNEYLRLK